MSANDIKDEVWAELDTISQIVRQLQYNHMDLHIADENHLTRLEEYGYGRLYPCNSALVAIINEKVERAQKLIDKMAV